MNYWKFSESERQFNETQAGALLTLLLMSNVGPATLRYRYATLAGAQAWAAFLFASYLFRRMVSLPGAWLDEFYDWARRYTLNAQIARLGCYGRAKSQCSRSGRVGCAVEKNRAYDYAQPLLLPLCVFHERAASAAEGGGAVLRPDGHARSGRRELGHNWDGSRGSQSDQDAQHGKHFGDRDASHGTGKVRDLNRRSHQWRHERPRFFGAVRYAHAG